MVVLPIVVALVASAQPPDACRGPLDREAVIACAREHSPRIRVDAAYVAVVDGQIDAARVMLPSNPRASLTVGHRSNPAGASAVNVSGTLSQELEIAGQRHKRGARRRADREVAEAEVQITARDVEAMALAAYYDVLAAKAEREVVDASVATATRLEEVAAGRASAGLAAPMDVDLAGARRARLIEELALAGGRLQVARSRLAATMGLDPTGSVPAVEGGLIPLAASSSDLRALTADAMSLRPELAQAAAARRAQEAQLHQLRRERIPNPSLSFFVQSDGFNERVIGGGLSFPIPLPAPLGRTHRGKIQATQARIRQSDASVDALGRQTLMEVAVAFHEFDARHKAVSAYPEAAAARATQNLTDLADEIEAGRVPVKDALITQQALLELLLRRVEAQHQLCLASVRLVLATGHPFEGTAR